MLDLERQIATEAPGLPAVEQFYQWAEAALQPETVQPDVDLTLVIRLVDEEESQTLNSQYRHQQKPTNILSFPFETPIGIDVPHLGDLVACAPVIAREAKQQNKPLNAHWAHMIVHGVLHLQGFDHQNDVQAEEMESLERQILASLGYPDPYEPIEDS